MIKNPCQSIILARRLGQATTPLSLIIDRQHTALCLDNRLSVLAQTEQKLCFFLKLLHDLVDLGADFVGR